MMRNFYRLWLILLMTSGAIALWFLGIASSDIWKFFHLNAKTSIEILDCQVCELPSSRFALEVHYQFEKNGTMYGGKEIVEKPQFLNQFAAENYMKTRKATTWEIWYWTKNPGYHYLVKEFPQKKCLHALLTIGVFFYFFFFHSARDWSARINADSEECRPKRE
jgi:hypothetical protein